MQLDLENRIKYRQRRFHPLWIFNSLARVGAWTVHAHWNCIYIYINHLKWCQKFWRRGRRRRINQRKGIKWEITESHCCISEKKKKMSILRIVLVVKLICLNAPIGASLLRPSSTSPSSLYALVSSLSLEFMIFFFLNLKGFNLMFAWSFLAKNWWLENSYHEKCL